MAIVHSGVGRRECRAIHALVLFLALLVSVHPALPAWAAPAHDAAVTEPDEARPVEDFRNLRYQWGFEPNLGQAPSDVAFVARLPWGSAIFTTDAVELVLTERGRGESDLTRSGLFPADDPAERLPAQHAGAIAREVFRLNVPSSLHGVPVPAEETGAVTHYVLGPDPAGWLSDVPRFGSLTYAGAEGAWRFSIGGQGNLRLAVAGVAGEPPRVALVSEASDREDPATARKSASATSSPLIQSVAPGVWEVSPESYGGSYIAGSADDWISAVAVGPDGRLHVAGWTDSPDFAWNEEDDSPNRTDAFLTSFHANGSEISTLFIGGSSKDIGEGVAVDAAGSVFVVGHTVSEDFPTTPGAFQETRLSIPRYDVFIVKLTDRVRVAYSTLLGGTETDIARAVAVDDEGRAVVVGATQSPDFPSVPGPLPEYAGGTDAFIAQFTAAGDALRFSRVIGGGRASEPFAETSWLTALMGLETWRCHGVDAARGVAVDGDFVHVVGITCPGPLRDFPIVNAVQPERGGDIDGFFTTIHAASGRVVTSTFVGGSSSDYANDVVVQRDGRIAITGTTWSSDFPAGAPLGLIGPGGRSEAFLLQLAADGTAWEGGSLFGGSGSEVGRSLALAPDGALHFTGSTGSEDFPVKNATQEFNLGTGSGRADAFLTVVDLSDWSIQRATWLGGSGIDVGRGVAVTSDDRSVVAGWTLSEDFPQGNLSFGAYGGAMDGFVALVGD